MNFKARKRDQFKGHKGKLLRKKLYGSKRKNQEVIDDEIRSLEDASLQFDPSKSQQFTEFPLSKKTLKGLSASKYEAPTDIQRESLGLALNGNDILGAAKTGSGKTLAFIIPVLECLYRQKWTQLDGLGALVISPTRELAFQTFEVLKKVGKFHDFSAGLVIGGKPLKEEAGRINRTNIVICTPGRLLQHMDETSYFSADSLKILVLDEADRILDLGFAQTMNAIIENLPTERQTLLFSATQTRSVKDLARLSLQDPLYVSVHENASESTPSQLEQSYVTCELHDKMSMLWSFLKNHLKSKILVFLTSCKQVKYIHDAMSRLQPGIPVLALHGGMPQLRRVEVYNQFVVKQRACLFATDIAARGLDFPAVNWVVQLDCPEDANTYIHRAGRTARYEKDGQSLLVLMPSEENGMLKQLMDKKIPVEKIRINPKKLYSIQAKLESNCAADPELKASAQRAFVTYLRSVFLMGNKKVFDVHALDIEQYARSLGLAIAPKVRFLKKDQKRREERAAKLPVTKATNLQVEKHKTKVKDQGKSSKKLDSDSEDTDSESDVSDMETANSICKALDSRLTSGSESGSSASEDEDNVKTAADASKTESSDRKVVRSKSDGESKLSEKNHEKEIRDKSKSNVEQGHKKAVEDTDSSSETDLDSDEGESDSDDSDDEVQTVKDKAAKSDKGSFRFDVEEDDDELFQVKKDVDIDKILGTEPALSEESQSKKSKKKTKQADREAQARKLLRKKIVVNTKVMFDEEGQPEVDRNKVPQVDIDTERPDNQGGINIELAKKRMQAEDVIDKQIFRQKIKQKHREERLKRKEENRAMKRRAENLDEGEDIVEARLLSDDDDDEKADPLSFIPDPDEIYGRHSDNSSSDEEEEDMGPSTSKYRKLSGQGIKHVSDDSSDMDDENSDGDSDSDSDIADTELSLRDDEALALKLLQGK